MDPIKAMREELQGLAEVNAALRKMVDHATDRIGQAEIELNAVLKIKGYLQIEIERKREILMSLEKDV